MYCCLFFNVTEEYIVQFALMENEEIDMYHMY